MVIMEKKEYKYHSITERIIGAAMKVHAILGNGFQEIIYLRALEIELEDTGLKFARELSIPVYYKSIQIAERGVDFFAEEK